MRCIYCLEPTTGLEGKAHVFPEAIVRDGWSLPKGSVCDNCNNYIGRKLESQLLRHPAIAYPIQLLGVVGKKGKPRPEIGIFRRDVPGAVLAFDVDRPEVTEEADGTKLYQWSVHPSLDPNFDLDRFRRALYHIAFNFLVVREGVVAGLDPQFNAVRRYVKEPKPKERWPFIQVNEPPEPVIPMVSVHLLPLPGKERIATVRIFSSQFVLDLHNTGALLRMRVTPSNPEARVHTVDADFKIDPPKRQPGERYRVEYY